VFYVSEVYDDCCDVVDTSDSTVDRVTHIEAIHAVNSGISISGVNLATNRIYPVLPLGSSNKTSYRGKRVADSEYEAVVYLAEMDYKDIIKWGIPRDKLWQASESHKCMVLAVDYIADNKVITKAVSIVDFLDSHWDKQKRRLRLRLYDKSGGSEIRDMTCILVLQNTHYFSLHKEGNKFIPINIRNLSYLTQDAQDRVLSYKLLGSDMVFRFLHKYNDSRVDIASIERLTRQHWNDNGRKLIYLNESTTIPAETVARDLFSLAQRRYVVNVFSSVHFSSTENFPIIRVLADLLYSPVDCYGPMTVNSLSNNQQSTLPDVCLSWWNGTVLYKVPVADELLAPIISDKLSSKLGRNILYLMSDLWYERGCLYIKDANSINSIGRRFEIRDPILEDFTYQTIRGTFLFKTAEFFDSLGFANEDKKSQMTKMRSKLTAGQDIDVCGSIITRVGASSTGAIMLPQTCTTLSRGCIQVTGCFKGLAIPSSYKKIHTPLYDFKNKATLADTFSLSLDIKSYKLISQVIRDSINYLFYQDFTGKMIITNKSACATTALALLSINSGYSLLNRIIYTNQYTRKTEIARQYYEWVYEFLLKMSDTDCADFVRLFENKVSNGYIYDGKFELNPTSHCTVKTLLAIVVLPKALSDFAIGVTELCTYVGDDINSLNKQLRDLFVWVNRYFRGIEDGVYNLLSQAKPSLVSNIRGTEWIHLSSICPLKTVSAFNDYLKSILNGRGIICKGYNDEFTEIDESVYADDLDIGW